MKLIRLIGSLAFVLGLFIVIFIGIPWEVHRNLELTWWLKLAIYGFLGGILVVLITIAFEQKKFTAEEEKTKDEYLPGDVLILNTDEIPGKKVARILGLVQGHTIYAIWIGKDLSAIIRLILGGELIEYAEMMGKARKVATERMIEEAKKLGADAIINVRFMTTSVIGSAAELLAYGTAVNFDQTKIEA